MALPFNHMVPRTVALSLCLALAACGGGGGGDSNGNGTPNPASTTSTVSGAASKGVLASAVVTAYAINNGGSRGNVLGQTRTDASGHYSLSLGSYSNPVLLELTVDAATLMTCDVPAPGCSKGAVSYAFGTKFTPDSALVLQSVIAHPAGNVQAAITPFTYLAAQLALKNGGSAAAIEAALSQLAALFDLPNLNATQPVDLTAATLGDDVDAQRYAVLNAAIARLGGAQLVSKLQALATEIKNNNGQLLKDGSANHLALADVLEAAQSVAQNAALNGKLDSLVNAVVTNSLQLVDGATGMTAVQPSPLAGSTDLAKAKSFISNTHGVIQSLRGLGNPDELMAGVQDKYELLEPFLNKDSGNHQMHELSYAAQGAFRFVADAAAKAAQDGQSRTYNKAAIQSYLDDIDFGGKVRLLAGNTLSATVDAATRKVSISGGISVQHTYLDWSCTLSACDSFLVDVGTAIPFTVSNLAISYPSLTTSQSSYEVSILPQGFVEGGQVHMEFLGTGSNKVVISYPSAQSLQSRIDNFDASPASIPDYVTLDLKDVKLTAGNTIASPAGVFVGRLSIRADKASFALTDESSSDRRTFLLPSTVSLNGAFTGPGGDSINATVSLALDKSSLGEQVRIVPEEGHVRTGLYTYKYNSATQKATVALSHPSERIYFWGWGGDSVAGVTLKLGADSWSNCASGQKTILGEGMYGDTVIGCTTKSTLPAALQEWQWGRTAVGYIYWGQWYLQALISGDAYYLPVTASNFNYASAATQSVNGEMVEGDTFYAEDSTHYLKGAASAVIDTSLSVNGKSLQATLKVDGRRLSQNSLDATVSITVAGRTVRVQSVGSLGATTYDLSDLNGVTVRVNLAKDSSEEPVIRVNGVELGRIKRIGNAYVARFVDNSLIAL